MTLHTETIQTPHGTRYTCTLHTDGAEIDYIGSGWCLTPAEAETQARRLYAIALSVETMSEGSKAA